MLSHLTFLDLCKSVHFMWPISSFSKLCYWLCPHDNLMSSSVYHQPFSLIPPCYDFQSISTVSYLSALSPLFPVSSFPSTLSKQVWISFMLFSVLIMGVQGSIHVCVGCLPPSLPLVMLPTRFWASPTPDTSFHSAIYCEITLMKTATRAISSTTQLFSSAVAPQRRQRSDWVGLSWTKRQILKQLVCAAHQETSHGWVHACPHHEC